LNTDIFTPETDNQNGHKNVCFETIKGISLPAHVRVIFIETTQDLSSCLKMIIFVACY
tara:strand:- start:46 stop:219 length:174 start_codon:yes stop_codon:yes gene_type:complete